MLAYYIEKNQVVFTEDWLNVEGEVLADPWDENPSNNHLAIWSHPDWRN
jgi:hypothetical protein